MILKKQVCSLRLSKELVKLGITAEPLFWHVVNIDPITPKDIIQKWQHSDFDLCEKYPAYTVAELGQMLPDYIESHSGCDGETWYCGSVDALEDEYFSMEAFEADARAAMLIYLLSNSENTNDCNRRLLEV